MSYTVEGPNGPKQRPRPVRLARNLSFAVAAGLAVFAAVEINAIVTTKITVEGTTSGLSNADIERGANVLAIIIGVIFAILVAAHVTVGALVGRGRNAARVVAWIVDGLTVLCCGFGLVNSLVNPGSSASEVTSTVNNATLRLTPSDMSTLTAVLAAVSLTVAVLGALAVIVLLALPASNAFFRTEQEIWTPPGWSGGGPSYPAGGPSPAVSGEVLPPSLPPSGSQWAPPATPEREPLPPTQPPPPAPGGPADTPPPPSSGPTRGEDRAPGDPSSPA